MELNTSPDVKVVDGRHVNRQEEQQAALDRLFLAREQQRDARSTVSRQFLPHGNGQPTVESMRLADAADAELADAQAVVDQMYQDVGREAD